MKDFVIMTIKNFSHTQTIKLQEYEKLYIFWFVCFFSLRMYNRKLVTSSLIIVGAHLTKKKKRYYTIRCND